MSEDQKSELIAIMMPRWPKLLSAIVFVVVLMAWGRAVVALVMSFTGRNVRTQIDVSEHDDVWITRRVDIARHWQKVHPYRKR